MQKFAMTCTCGHVMDVEADSREAAVAKMKAEMTQEALDAHMLEKHKAGEPSPSLAETHAMIEMQLQPA